MSNRLGVEPPLDPVEFVFVAGFAREPVRDHDGRAVESHDVARTWPGQPAPPCPWVPCADGCCLLLGAGRSRPEAAAQWLRFLLGTFLAPGHRVTGSTALRGVPGVPPGLLVVEGGEVFEGVFEGWVS